MRIVPFILDSKKCDAPSKCTDVFSWHGKTKFVPLCNVESISGSISNTCWWRETFFHKIIACFCTTVVFFFFLKIAARYETPFIDTFCSCILWPLLFCLTAGDLVKQHSFCFCVLIEFLKIYPLIRFDFAGCKFSSVLPSVWTPPELTFLYPWPACSFIQPLGSIACCLLAGALGSRGDVCL